jgi:hypothetical protein
MNWANQSIIPGDDIQDNQSTKTNQSQSTKWRHDDLSQGSRACRHASPCYVPLHHVVRWLIGITHRASQKTPQEPIKWQEVAMTWAIYYRCLWCFTEVGTNPSQSPEMAKNNHQLLPTPPSCSKPSRWRQPPREIKIPQQINEQVPTRCNLTMQMHLDHSISLRIWKEAREMSGRGVA